jgi:hypothetical protein
MLTSSLACVCGKCVPTPQPKVRGILRWNRADPQARCASWYCYLSFVAAVCGGESQRTNPRSQALKGKNVDTLPARCSNPPSCRMSWFQYLVATSPNTLTSSSRCGGASTPREPNPLPARCSKPPRPARASASFVASLMMMMIPQPSAAVQVSTSSHPAAMVCARPFALAVGVPPPQGQFRGKDDGHMAVEARSAPYQVGCSGRMSAQLRVDLLRSQVRRVRKKVDAQR